MIEDYRFIVVSLLLFLQSPSPLLILRSSNRNIPLNIVASINDPPIGDAVP